MRRKILSLTKKDFRVDTFRSGGPGGQNQNKVSSGVRITHTASGISAESRESRSQAENKRIAFERLAKSPQFQAWLRGVAGEVDREVDELMKEENLKVEVRREGKWVTLTG